MKKRRKEVDWKRYGIWFEAEGTKPTIKDKQYQNFEILSQAYQRADIVEKICGELARLGFGTKIIEDKRTRTLRCRMRRIADQTRFVTETYPYYESEHTKEWAETYLKELAKRKPRKKLILKD